MDGGDQLGVYRVLCPTSKWASTTPVYVKGEGPLSVMEREGPQAVKTEMARWPLVGQCLTKQAAKPVLTLK